MSCSPAQRRTCAAASSRRAAHHCGSTTQSPTRCPRAGTPMARRSSARAMCGAGAEPVASSAARNRAAPRRRSSGGRTSRTSIPAAIRCCPGSRSSPTSATRSGSGRASRSRAAAGPSRRTRTGTAADPTCSTSWLCSVSSAVPGPRRATSISAVSRHAPGVRTVSPRPMSRRSTPRRFSATRATAPTRISLRPKDCSPRTVTRRPACSSSSPTRTVPAASVPVTTVPAPRTVKLRSTHSRTSACGSGGGSRSVSATSSARTRSRSVPIATGTPASEVAANRSVACATAGPGSARSALLITSSPCRTRSASSAARCSSDCGIQPSVAATTNTTAGTGPTPASMLATKRSWPGTSTKASRRPASSVHTKPKSMVRPRRCSSASRSGHMPVSRCSRVDLP